MIFDVDFVLFSPLIATVFLAATSGMIGAILVTKKQSLFGETISHASYPGFVIGALLGSFFLYDGALPSFLGAVITSVITVFFVRFLIRCFGVSEDAAQTSLLASSFAVGLLILSAVQTVFPSLSRVMQALLLGQAATISDRYIPLTIAVFFITAIFLWISIRSMSVGIFDPSFGKVSGLTHVFLDYLFSSIAVLCILLSSKIMGVVLMSALLIFPAVSARLLSRSFCSMVVFAALLGALGGFLGVFISHQTALFHESSPVWIPTGPLVTLILALIFFLIFIFSPREGLVIQSLRRCRFRRRCRIENALKVSWKILSTTGGNILSLQEFKEACGLFGNRLKNLVSWLEDRGYLSCNGNELVFTKQALLRGKKLVRLHRLWELYLVQYCHFSKEKVHPSAEEMEHILTGDIEKELTNLLHDPFFDPHNQVIPQIQEEEREVLSLGKRSSSFFESCSQGILYGIQLLLYPVIFLRKKYLTRISRSRQLLPCVISVGNVTFGGSGKTPFIQKLLQDMPERTGYVSRGYRRKEKGLYVSRGAFFKEDFGGDEAKLLSRLYPELLIAIDDSKWKALCAIQKRCDFIIVDDALQRYDIPFDISIGIISGLYPYGQIKGLLREPFSRLSSTDYLVVTNRSALLKEDEEKIIALRVPTIWTDPEIAYFFDARGEKMEIERSKKVALFSGIAHPKRFFQIIASMGYTIVDHRALQDHDPYIYAHVQKWAEDIRKKDPNVVLIGTEKDFVRHPLWGIPEVYFTHLDMRIVSGLDVYESLVQKIRRGEYANK